MPAGSFALDISNWAGKTMARQDTILQKVSLDITKGVTMTNPVDTGRSRASWRVGINNVDLSTMAKLKSGEHISPMDAYNMVIEKARAIIEDIRAGDIIFVSNNVEYVPYLEDGHSQQAPNGMVAVTLRRFPGIVETAVQDAKKEYP